MSPHSPYGQQSPQMFRQGSYGPPQQPSPQYQWQRTGPPKKHHPVLVTAGILGGIAVIAAVVASSGSGSGGGAQAGILTCHQRYENWFSANQAELDNLVTRLGKARDDADAEESHPTRTAIERVGTAASQVSVLPRCADPRRYFTKMRSQLITAGHNARELWGPSGVWLANQSIRSAGSVIGKMNRELKRTVGEQL